MTKLLTVLLLSSIMVSCNKSGGNSGDATTALEQGSAGDNSNNPPPQSPDEDDPVAPVDPIPTQAETFDTNITFVNFTALQEEKYQQAIEMVKRVVATEAFKTKVLNHTYNGKKTYVDNGGFSNAQIYQKILDAAEELQPSKNNTMDLEVELYYAATSTVGYTYPNSKRIWVNTKYFNSYAVSAVANNLFHEWLHKLGFGHSSSYSTARDYSVPYAIGDMMEAVGKTLL